MDAELPVRGCRSTSHNDHREDAKLSQGDRPSRPLERSSAVVRITENCLSTYWSNKDLASRHYWPVLRKNIRI